MRECLHAFKYSGILSLAPLFVSLLEQYLEEHPFLREVDYLLPVPLHPRRLRERGFNQALLLARPLSLRWRIPLLHREVIRWKETLPQVHLSAKERRKNVLRAFRVVSRFPWQGKSILIIDDILTTRATVDALSAALKDAGCRKVMVLTVASGK